MKSLLFVRNTYRLINGLCLAVGCVIGLYSFASAWALAGSMADIGSYSSLFVIPIVSIIISILLWRRCVTVKPANGGSEKQRAYMMDFITASNLIIALILAFFQLDKVSSAKNTGGFGTVPIYLVIIGGIIFYVLRIKKMLDEK